MKKNDNEFSYFLISYQEKNNKGNTKKIKESLLYRLSKEDFNFNELSLHRDTFTTPGDDGKESDSSGGGTPCSGIWIPEYNSCNVGGNPDGHEPQKQWNDTYCSGSSLTGYIIDFSHCTNYQPPAGPGKNTDNGSSGDSTNGNSGGGGSSNNNDGSNSGSSGGSTFTSPLGDGDGSTKTAAEIAANNVNSFLGNMLSSQELDWLSKEENFNLSIQLETFLFNNNSDSSKGKVIEFIEALMNSNLPIDFAPENPVNDVTDFLKCYDISKPAKLTVYVTEPKPGSGATHKGVYVGHTFVSLSQGTNTNTYGFYPTSNNIYPIINDSSSSVLGNDGVGNEPFTASISTTVSGSQLEKIIHTSINHNSTYDLNNYNCTDFAIELGNLGGLNLPESNGNWPGGGGSNPGTLGLYIRSLLPSQNGITTETKKGSAPKTKKGC